MGLHASFTNNSPLGAAGGAVPSRGKATECEIKDNNVPDVEIVTQAFQTCQLSPQCPYAPSIKEILILV